jgi:L-ascorbate metabolism protein UlaG (beta-lactamase superfamily)
MIGLKSPPNDLFYEPLAGDHLEVTYLGTAGFVLKNAERTLVLDPFINRPGLFRTLFGQLPSHSEPLKKLIPHADDVLIGHAHYDHILDAPLLCQQTGARLIGSRATMMVGRAAGLPESRLLETNGREDIACGSWTIRGLPSVHGKALFGRIPLPGDITTPPPWPPKLRQLRHGQVFNWWVETGGIRVVHIDSADFIEEELAGLQADLVCLCAIGRRYRQNYVQDVVRLLKPRWILPCHWDTMITPIDAPPELIPGVDLPGLLAEIQATGVTPLLTPLLGRQGFPCCH